MGLLLKVALMDEVYRIVWSSTKKPWRTGGYSGKQHFYPKESTARGVVTQWNQSSGPQNQVEYQKGVITWQDI